MLLTSLWGFNGYTPPGMRHCVVLDRDASEILFAASRMAKRTRERCRQLAKPLIEPISRPERMPWVGTDLQQVRPSLLTNFLSQPDGNDEKQLWLILPNFVCLSPVCLSTGVGFSWIKFNNWAAMHLNDLTKLMEWFYLVFPGKMVLLGEIS